MPDGKKAPPVSYADRMAEGFTPTSMPPLGPDGAPVFTPASLEPLPLVADSLCQLGPCRYYHELVTSFDAQEPLGEETGAPRYRNTVRTCYPAVGIEADLGEGVIYDCNFWDPVADGFVEARALRRSAARARQDAALVLPEIGEPGDPEGEVGGEVDDSPA